MDEKARRRFEQMYQEYEGTVRRLAYGYNIPVDYIDDIVQDTFVSYAQYDFLWSRQKRARGYFLAGL